MTPNKSLQATRDGRFPRRQGYAGQASSASRFTLIGPACLWTLGGSNYDCAFGKIH